MKCAPAEIFLSVKVTPTTSDNTLHPVFEMFECEYVGITSLIISFSSQLEILSTSKLSLSRSSRRVLGRALLLLR